MATSSYQINYYNQLLVGSITDNPNVVLPPPKQTTAHKAWLNTLLAPVQRLNDLMYIDYDFGSTYSFYSSTHSYILGDRINGNIAYQNGVLECTTATTSGTFSISNWTKILPTFIGFEERKLYVDSRIVFEYALNRYFRTIFRQPNFADTVKSDIYIGDNDISSIVFVIGPDDFSSSFISNNFSTRAGFLSNNVWVGPDPSIYPTTGVAFTIFITATAYSGLPGYNAGLSYSADSAIRFIADTINYTGMPYAISQY